MSFGKHHLQVRNSIVLTAAVLTVAVCCLFWYSQVNPKEGPEIVDNMVLKIPVYQQNVKLLFLGDIMLDRGIRYYANKNGGYDYVFEKVKPVFENYDLVVPNLEGPITNNNSVSITTKAGDPNNFYFTFDPIIAQTLFDQNIKLVNLGNNHILNFYSKGLVSTKDYLDKAGVDYFGVPDDKRSAFKEIKGVKIAFIGYNEFYGKSETNKEEVISEIKKYKSEADIIAVFCHWGIEYVKTPNKNQVDLAHNFVDAGADLIIGGHPHVIQTIEEYNGKKIYYSLGNFIFDMYFTEDVRNGMGVEVSIDKQTKKLDFTDMNFYLEKGGQTVLE